MRLTIFLKSIWILSFLTNRLMLSSKNAVSIIQTGKSNKHRLPYITINDSCNSDGFNGIRIFNLQPFCASWVCLHLNNSEIRNIRGGWFHKPKSLKVSPLRLLTILRSGACLPIGRQGTPIPTRRDNSHPLKSNPC